MNTVYNNYDLFDIRPKAFTIFTILSYHPLKEETNILALNIYAFNTISILLITVYNNYDLFDIRPKAFTIFTILSYQPLKEETNILALNIYAFNTISILLIKFCKIFHLIIKIYLKILYYYI